MLPQRKETDIKNKIQNKDLENEKPVKDMFTFCNDRLNKCYDVIPSKVDIEIFNFGEKEPIYICQLDSDGKIELNKDGSIADHRKGYGINDDVKMSFKFYDDTLYQLNENGDWDKFSPQGNKKD